MPDGAPTKFGVSQSVVRVEDARLLRGEGAYVDDINWERQTRAVLVRSSVAHGRIRGVDLAAARSAPGVLAALSGADLDARGVNAVSVGQIANRDGSKSAAPLRPALATDRVRYVGEGVAVIVAETLAQARDAADLVEVDIEILDAVATMTDALKPGAPQLHESAPGNICFQWGIGDEAAADAALAASARVVTLDLVNNRVVSNPMETRGVAAAWDAAAGRLHVETNAQGVWAIKSELARRLGLAPEAVHVTTGDVGGGFGTKAYAYPEQVLVAELARIVGRPVKWVADRSEGFVSDAMGRDHETTARAGFDVDGRLTALKIETRAGMGGQLSPFGVYIPTSAASKVVTGVYDVSTLYYGVTGVFTNTTPVDAYRGAGRPESIYMLERLMDHAARALGIDPIDLRRRNFIRPDQMPYVTVVGESYDTGDFDRVISAAAARADLAGFGARRAEAASRGQVRGVGICYYIEAILGDASETAKLELTEDGFADLYVGTQSNGQGHETAYAQILHERIGLPFDRIRIVQGDSDRIATGGGTGGSRSVTTQGMAIYAAGDALVEQLKPLAEEELEVSAADLEYRDGAFHVVGADLSVDLLTLGAKARARGRAEVAIAEERTTLPGRSYPNGCHVAEIEIDPETGRSTLVRYTIVDDFGTLINPMLAEGQAHGGIVQGLGQALTEAVVYDADGQLLSGSFMDYAMPRADDAPWFDFTTEPTPSVTNPFGMKGCGEAGTVGALAAIANAARDALAPLGVERVDMPLTPLNVWRRIEEAKARAARA